MKIIANPNPCLACLLEFSDGILQTNVRRPHNAGLMLGQCRRRWPNIKPALDECLMFAGFHSFEVRMLKKIV